MPDYLEPANSNLTFTDIVSDPKRMLADDTLRPVVHLLERSGIPNTQIADVLFDYVMLEVVPRGELDGPAITGYLAQLKRFHSALVERIDKLENSAG